MKLTKPQRNSALGLTGILTGLFALESEFWKDDDDNSSLDTDLSNELGPSLDSDGSQNDEIQYSHTYSMFNISVKNPVSYERYTLNGELHREDGPALIKHDGNDTVTKSWYINGKLHRDGAPAVIKEYKGLLVSQQWYQNGVRHRDTGPQLSAYSYVSGELVKEQWYDNGSKYSEISYYEDGSQTEWWIENDRIHLEGAPAVIKTSAEGIILEEHWMINDQEHRAGGPSFIKYSPVTGLPIVKYWEQNGRRHRSDGPAVILYDENTQKITYEAWYCRGQRYEPLAGKACPPHLR